MIEDVEQLVAAIETLDLEGLRNVWREHDGVPPSLRSVHPRLAAVAKLLMAGEIQAAIARRLHLTDAAISKRIKSIRAIVRIELADLRGSPLLT